MSALSLGGCALTPSATELRGEGLGTSWSVKLGETASSRSAAMAATRSGATAQRDIQQRVDEVARHLSRWEPTSSLNALNAATANEWQAVPSELRPALSYALQLSADTGGAYDPTVGALVDVWGFGTRGRRFEPPAREAIEAARARVGYAKVTLDVSGARVRKPAGLQIDLSSMTHGYAADQIASYLDEKGVQDYLIDVGGEMRARGVAAGGQPWRVAIERPPAESSEAPREGAPAAVPVGTAVLKSVSLRDAGIATSGNYRYYFDHNGRRYSHRIDPRTGEPVAHSLASVTVIDEQCMRADALATALTVLGPDEGLEYATSRGIAALFVLRTSNGLVERMTPRFAAYLN